MIDIHDVSLKLEGAPILKGVSAKIPPTGITAIIGPNGAGKSTLLHAMAGLLPLSSGQISISDHNIHRLSPMRRATYISLLTQREAVSVRLTVYDLLMFGRWPHHRGRPKEVDRQAIAEAAEIFDLKPLFSRRLDTLSGGQRQRAFVAMSYVQNTPYMLLDEPLAALDPRYAVDIMKRLSSLSDPQKQDRGVVIVLHDLAMAIRYADYCVALKEGKTAFEGV
ncbi:MAG: ATP-binding cassette domain-containing protein, partial [Pseudomonadota bacterium]